MRNFLYIFIVEKRELLGSKGLYGARVFWCCFVLGWLSLGGCQASDLCGGSCLEGQVCVSGSCVLVCSGKMFRCGGKCIDPWVDKENCGRCGIVCSGEMTCAEGRCVPPCEEETPNRCGESCVDIRSNARHCGACGQECRAGQRCIEGGCACAAGLAACGEACVDLSNTSAHCGACGQACAEGEVCASGACVVGDCPAATPTQCFGGCVDLQSNDLHCGTCGRSCPSQQICVAAKCVCPKDQTSCDGEACVDLMQDRRHCGACGNACPSGQLCAGGTCVGSCPAGTPTTCFGGCVDLQANTLHCGSCGKRCSRGLRCREGACCAASENSCGGKCVDLRSDAAHCGACGKACGTGGVCELGQCCLTGCSYLRMFAEASAQRVVVDAKGNVFVAGLYSATTVNLDDRVELKTNNYRALFVVSFDADGKALWGKSFYGSGPNQNTVDALVLGPQGDLHLAGSFTQELQVGQQTLKAVTRDIFLIRLSAQGEILGMRSLEGNGEERCRAMVVDALGAVTIAGETLGDKWLDQSHPLLGDTDLFLAHFDPQGKLLWFHHTGGTGADSVTGLALDSSKNLYFSGILGASSKAASFGATSLPLRETTALVGKIDAQGKFVWVRGYEGSGPALGNAVAWHKGAQGVKVYLGGQFAGQVNFGVRSALSKGGYDGFLLQLDEQGKEQWIQTFGGAGPKTDAVQQIRVASSGEVAIAGVFDSDSLEVVQPPLLGHGLFDPFLLRVDEKGNTLSALHFGGSGADYAFGLDLSAQGDAYLVGFLASPLFVFLEKGYPKPKGNNAAFLMRVRR